MHYVLISKRIRIQHRENFLSSARAFIQSLFRTDTVEMRLRVSCQSLAASDILEILCCSLIEWKFSPLAIYLHLIKYTSRNPKAGIVNIPVWMCVLTQTMHIGGNATTVLQINEGYFTPWVPHYPLSLSWSVGPHTICAHRPDFCRITTSVIHESPWLIITYFG